MSLTIEITPDLEPLLVAEATRTGSDPGSAAQAVLRKSLAPSHSKTAPRMSAEESKLLEAINQGPTTFEMDECVGLIRKRQSETSSDAEFERLDAFTKGMEQLAVSRMKSLASLAELRGVDVEQLMQELDITPPDVL